MKLDFVINGRFLTQRMTGVHRHAYEMCRALKQEGANFVVVAPKNILPDYDLCFDVVTCGKFSSHLWEQVELPYYLNRNYKNCTLLNFTGLGSIFYKKTVCTVHDVSFLQHPEWFTKSYYYLYRILTPITVRKASKVLTVSEFSKKELIDVLRTPADKIEVIYNAATNNLVFEKDSINRNHKYILTVSSIEPRKNFKRLIKAFNLLDNKDYKLYIVGKKDKIFNEVGFEELNDNIVFTGYITDSELAQYYSEATAFVYASLYEGFGIPNLEAMTNGCPVLASDIPPHREVCGEAAVYFNPLDVEDMAKKISHVIENDNIRNILADKGRERATMFSWQLSARKLMKIIADIDNR